MIVIDYLYDLFNYYLFIIYNCIHNNFIRFFIKFKSLILIYYEELLLMVYFISEEFHQYFYFVFKDF